MTLQYKSDMVMIHELIEKAVEDYKDHTAFVDKNKRFTFEEINRLSLRMAKHFLALGLKKGDVVAAQLPNSWEFVVTHLAASRIGLVFNPLSPAYRKKELNYMLGHCDTKIFVTVDQLKGLNHAKLATELKDELPELEHVIVAGNTKDNNTSLFSELLEEDPTSITDQHVKSSVPTETDPAIIMFTSGTESNPKAVLHTFETFVPAHLINGQENQVNDEDTILSLTPLCHMFSLPMIIVGMKYGAKHYLVSEYETNQVMNILENEKVTSLIAAPAHLIDMIHYIRENDKHELSLRFILTGGSKIPSEMVKNLRELIGCSVGAQWGMTELCAGTFTRPDDHESYAWETVGRVTPVGEVIVVDENEQPLPNGETGEVAFKGDCLFREYYRNPEATEEAFNDAGYFLTGDQGWLDGEGYLHFVGRTKDTINRGGLKFHASEVEEALQMHPDIQQAAVVSVPDPRLGERACAFVSLRKDISFEIEELKTFLTEKGFAKYKLPEYLEVKESLPTTPSGKITKAPLRAEAEKL